MKRSTAGVGVYDMEIAAVVVTAGTNMRRRVGMIGILRGWKKVGVHLWWWR